jgi:hypothetical protein
MEIDGRKTLKGREPHKGTGQPEGRRRETLEEKRPREVFPGLAGETGRHAEMRRSGNKLQGRPEPKMEANFRKEVRGSVQIRSCVR